jgi:hypothetical protein
MELGGTVVGDQHDQLDVAGDLNLDGTLQVLLIGGFAPDVDDMFDILDFGDGALNGAFDSVVLPELGGHKVWDTSKLYTTGEVFVTPEPATAVLLLLGLGAVVRRRRK